MTPARKVQQSVPRRAALLPMNLRVYMMCVAGSVSVLRAYFKRVAETSREVSVRKRVATEAMRYAR